MVSSLVHESSGQPIYHIYIKPALDKKILIFHLPFISTYLCMIIFFTNIAQGCLLSEANFGSKDLHISPSLHFLHISSNISMARDCPILKNSWKTESTASEWLHPVCRPPFFSLFRSSKLMKAP